MPREPWPITPTVGGQLDLVDIVGREETVRRWWALLEHASLRLNEPRRFGKTQTLKLLVASPPPGWSGVLVSFEGSRTVEEFVKLLLSRILRHRSIGARMGSALQTIVRHVSSTKTTVEGVTLELAPAFATAPLAALEQGLRQIAKHLGDDHLVLACDEVPDTLRAIGAHEDPSAAKQLLATLRRLREDPELEPIRWLLTGSVGFHHVLRSFDERRGEIRAAEVGELLSEAAADLDASAAMTPLLTRLHPYYGSDRSLAEALLDALATAPAAREALQGKLRGATAADTRRVLELLQLDHYLAKDSAGVFRWRYPALARVWVVRRL